MASMIFGYFRAERRIQEPHSLGLSHIVPAFGKDHHQPVTSLFQRAAHRNGICDPAILVRDAVDHNRAACRRDRAGRHDGTVIILLHPFFPKISGFSGQGICRHYFVLHGAFHDSGKYPADLFRRNLSVLRICTEGRTGCLS